VWCGGIKKKFQTIRLKMEDNSTGPVLRKVARNKTVVRRIKDTI